ncbi:MAG: transglutaminase family protein, partial [Acidimicrobiales bacterium]
MSLTDVEAAAEGLAEESGEVEADLEAAASAVAEVQIESEAGSPLRLATACAMSSLGAAVMIGGIFQGAGGRIYACVFAVAGVGLGVVASRLRRASTALPLIALGLFAAGLLAALPTGYSNLVHVKAAVSLATREGSILRPPVDFLPGWHAIVGWLMATTGLVSIWTALVVKRQSLGLLLPLPLAAIAGISVPKDAQVASGIVVLVLFAASLGLVSGLGSNREEDVRRPLGYELRRAAKSVVFLAVVSAALVGLSRTHVLFPAPVINPTEQAQLPKTVPLTSSTTTRVLFDVRSKVTGPWRIGSLDVYDGTYWRLPPEAQAQIKPVPRSGVVDSTLPTGETATFTVEGLTGAILPTLPNTVGIVASGPELAYDARGGNIRLLQGQAPRGFTYTVAAAPLPKVTALESDSRPLPRSIRQFLQVPPAPPAVRALINQLKGTNKWDTFNSVREWILQNVTVAGEGQPVAVPPSEVVNMIDGSKQGTPFEIVAAQALLARWVGVPSRIGYGFDGGRLINQLRQVTPANASTFVEVYFPGYEWLPVIGSPVHAKATSTTGPQQPSGAQAAPVFGANIFVPVPTPPASVFALQLAQGIGIGIGVLALLALLYLAFPAFRKSVVRSRRRSAARAAGPAARVALSYAEWRDLATDLGYK